MGTLASVPSAVRAILLRPRIASLFADGLRDDGRNGARAGRTNRRPPRISLGSIVVGYMPGVAAIVFVPSAPVAIHLLVAMVPDR